MTNTIENLTKALHSAQFLESELRLTLKTADAVVALVLMPMVVDAVAVRQRVQNLLDAMGE